jgi:hypothetical protein
VGRQVDVVGEGALQRRVRGLEGRVDRLRGLGEGVEEGRVGEDVGEVLFPNTWFSGEFS